MRRAAARHPVELHGPAGAVGDGDRAEGAVRPRRWAVRRHRTRVQLRLRRRVGAVRPAGGSLRPAPAVPRRADRLVAGGHRHHVRGGAGGGAAGGPGRPRFGHLPLAAPVPHGARPVRGRALAVRAHHRPAGADRRRAAVRQRPAPERRERRGGPHSAVRPAGARARRRVAVRVLDGRLPRPVVGAALVRAGADGRPWTTAPKRAARRANRSTRPASSAGSSCSRWW